MTIVEEAWFGWRFRGDEPSPSWADVDWQADEDWDSNSAVRDDPDALRAGYRDAIARSDMIIDAADLAEIAATESQYAGADHPCGGSSAHDLLATWTGRRTAVARLPGCGQRSRPPRRRGSGRHR